ncbi:MAG: chemotaxis protein CheC [Nanoarchaeota archaeon]
MIKKTNKKIIKKSKKTTNKLSNLQIDALREISSITSGNATSALAKLINKRVKINIPKAEFLTIKELTNELGGKDKMVMSIYVTVLSEVTGQAIFLFSRKSALKMIDLVLKKDIGKTKVLDHLSESAFGEMANIFVGTYLNALSNMFKLTILPGIPVVANDYVGPILEYVMGRITNPEKKTLCFETKINIDGNDVSGDFIFMFDEKSYSLILKKLKDNYDITF